MTSKTLTESVRTLEIEPMRCRRLSLVLVEAFGMSEVHDRIITITYLLSQKFQVSSYHAYHGSFSKDVLRSDEITNPYKIAYIVVALRLMTTVLTRTANGPSTNVKITQKKAVTNVLQASDPRRPREVSTKYAPSCFANQFTIEQLFLQQ